MKVRLVLERVTEIASDARIHAIKAIGASKSNFDLCYRHIAACDNVVSGVKTLMSWLQTEPEAFNATIMTDHLMSIDDSQRQTILLALGHLAVQRPGWDMMLNEIALKIDNVADGRALTYEEFKKTAPPRAALPTGVIVEHGPRSDTKDTRISEL